MTTRARAFYLLKNRIKTTYNDLGIRLLLDFLKSDSTTQGSTIKDRRTMDTGHAHGWHIMVGLLHTVLSPSNHHINASSHITFASLESFYWTKTNWSANKANKAHHIKPVSYLKYPYLVKNTGHRRDTSNANLIKISLILNQLDRDGMELGCLCGTSGL